MANQNKNAQAKRQQNKASTLTWIILVGTLLVILAGPTMVVLFFGLLPTIVARLIDRSVGKSTTYCVGSINFIGVFPYVVNLWGGDNSFPAAFSITTDLVTMMIMYAAAAFGWLVYMALPSLISSFVMIMQQRKVAQLRGEQKLLIEEWGSDVAAIVEQQRATEQENHMEKSFS